MGNVIYFKKPSGYTEWEAGHFCQQLLARGGPGKARRLLKGPLVWWEARDLGSSPSGAMNSLCDLGAGYSCPCFFFPIYPGPQLSKWGNSLLSKGFGISEILWFKVQLFRQWTTLEGKQPMRKLTPGITSRTGVVDIVSLGWSGIPLPCLKVSPHWCIKSLCLVWSPFLWDSPSSHVIF